MSEWGYRPPLDKNSLTWRPPGGGQAFAVFHSQHRDSGKIYSALAILYQRLDLGREVAARGRLGIEHMAAAVELELGAIGPATIVVVSIVIGTLIVSIMSALLSITELAQ